MAEKGKSPRKGGKRGGDKDVVPATSGSGTSRSGGTDMQELVQQMLRDPHMTEAIQGHLSGLVGKSSGYIESLPEPVQRRIRALKNIQVDIMGVEEQFHQEVCKLQASFEEKFKDLYSKRKSIVAGEYEPTEEESKWNDGSDDEDKEEEDKEDEKEDAEDKTVKEEKDAAEEDESNKKEAEEKPKEAEGVDVKGIPSFWLTAMKNVELLEPLIREWDNPVLEKLMDIRVVYPDANGLDFVLEFHFDENEYFTQRVLTKKYKIKCKLDPEAPFSFEGPEIVSSEGCKISWKDNKNVTLKTVKKTQKHKSKGQTRTVMKTVKQESFFHFFEGVPEPSPDEDADDDDGEEMNKRDLDFARGEFFRDSFIQKAVLFFTGEIDNDSDDDYDEDDDDYLNEDYDEEADPDFLPGIEGGPNASGKPPECKQQ